MTTNLEIREKGIRKPLLHYNNTIEDRHSHCKLLVQGPLPLEAQYWLLYPQWMRTLLLDRKHLSMIAIEYGHKEIYSVSEQGMRLLDLFDRGYRFFILDTKYENVGGMSVPCPQTVKFFGRPYEQEVIYPQCLQFADIEEPEHDGHERLWIIHESRVHGLFEENEDMQGILNDLAEQQQRMAAKYHMLRHAGRR